MTMNSPDSLAALYQLATSSSSSPEDSIAAAELMREVGLKCISFNGIPRSINCLNAFKASLPDPVAQRLSARAPSRAPTPANITDIAARGRALWDSIYRPHENKLYDKLADAHPDLPVHILNANYGALLADPEPSAGAPGPGTAASVGRLKTSIVAVACLRAQSGVGPQVTSHVFGLRKAVEDGSWAGDGESEAAARWLAGEDGNAWILGCVDAIVAEIGEGLGSSFAPGREAKL